MDVKVGDIYEVFYKENHIDNIPKIYVLAIVDDYMIVIKHHRKKGRGWSYRVIHESYFDGQYITKR